MLDKKFVYFHIDELNRDSITASALKKELKSRNIHLIYGGRVYYRLIKYFASFFNAIILPKPQFLTYANKTKFRFNNIIMLYTENIGIIADSDNEKLVLKGALDCEFMSGDPDYVNMVTAFCFWGSGVRDTIVKHYPYLKDKCFVVGHPRHSKYALPKKRDVNESLSRKKTIGVMTRHTYLNEYANKNPLEKLAFYGEDKVLYEYYNKETNDFLVNERRGSIPEEDVFCEALDAKFIFKIIKEAIKRNYNINVKIHPREGENVWPNIFKKMNIHVSYADPMMPFTHWLESVDHLVGPPSSGFFDSVMLGLPPISINRLDSRREKFEKEISDENNKLMEFISKPSSIEELFLLLESNPTVDYSDALNAVLLKEANYPHCKDSMVKIADVVEAVIRNNKKTSFVTRWFGICVYFVLEKMVNVLFILRYRKSKNFSSLFITTRSIAKFIDNLAS